MAQTSTNMLLVRWTNLTDPYDSGQLAENWQKIDLHDHTADHGVQIPAGGLAANSVTTVKIFNENVTEEKIASNAITTVKIKDANVTNIKLAPSSVTTSKIEDSVSAVTGVTTAKIADGSVTTSKVADANVTEAKLAAESVTVTKLGTSSVTTDKIANNAVTTDKILSNTIVDGDINASANIAPSKIAGTAVITTDSRLSNSRTPTSHSGTHALAGSDPITISPSQVSGTAVVTGDSRLSDTRTPTDNTVSTAKVQDNAVTKVKLKSNGTAGDGTDARIIFNGQTLEFGTNNIYTGGTATVADGAITTPKLADYVSGSNPVTGVSTAKIQDLAITTAKIARQTSNYVLIGKGASADVEFGFLTESNFGTNKLSNNVLTNSSISINGTSVNLGGSISGLATSASPTFTGTVTAPLSTGVVKSSSSGVLSSSTVNASDITDATITKAKLDLTVQGSIPTYVTSLPSSPTDGQEVYYQASSTDESSVVNTSVWHLRYRAVTNVVSGTGVAIGTGSKILNVSSTTGFALGDYVKVVLDGTKYFEGYITAISSNTSVTVDSKIAVGTGTATTISLAYPWEAVGGRPTSKYNFTNTAAPTGSGAIQNTWYNGWGGDKFAALTIPLAGQYDISYAATSSIDNGFSGTYSMGLGLGSSDPAAGAAARLPYNTSVTGNLISAGQFSKETFTSSTVSGNRIIKLYVRYSTTLGTSVTVADQRLTLTPIRLANWS